MIFRAFTIAMFVCLAGGCASKSPSESAVQLGAASSGATGRRLASSDNGLELQRWTVFDKPGQTMQALLKHADPPAVDEATQLRLKRNGFRFVRVPLDQLEALQIDLGGAPVNVNEWHGQVPEWRSLQDRPLDGRGKAVAIDGHVERYDRGEFRLMIRSWSVQLEDGPCVHLEALPLHQQPQASGLRRLLGEESPIGKGFGSMALDVQLQAGWAYVLLSEMPQVDWPGLDAPDQPPRGSPSNAAKAMVRAPKYGPGDVSGPDAPAPLTMGELLLPLDRDPPTRSLLVFIARISPEQFPAQASPEHADGG